MAAELEYPSMFVTKNNAKLIQIHEYLLQTGAKIVSTV